MSITRKRTCQTDIREVIPHWRKLNPVAPSHSGTTIGRPNRWPLRPPLVALCDVQNFEAATQGASKTQRRRP